tara:strand:+ start:211 stop:963 length:753 start_codon:yes stop_codon:yes gene_type:complete
VKPGQKAIKIKAMNYTQANTKLGNRDSRKLQNNTYLQRRESGAIAVLLHATDVVTFNPDGTTVLNSGGWRTVTTKDRINTYLPFHRIDQVNHIWYISGKAYSDGMVIGKRGGIQKSASARDLKRQKKLKDAMNKYVDGFIEALLNCEIKAPSSGDCWCCSFKDKEGKTLGELNSSDHIINHFKEKYYVPSLLVNAIKEFSVSPIVESMLHELVIKNNTTIKYEDFIDIFKKQVKDSLTKYLKRQLTGNCK